MTAYAALDDTKDYYNASYKTTQTFGHCWRFLNLHRPVACALKGLLVPRSLRPHRRSIPPFVSTVSRALFLAPKLPLSAAAGSPVISGQDDVWFK